MNRPTDALPDGLRHLADPVLAFDERGRVVGWNPSLAEVVGLQGDAGPSADRILDADDADRLRAAVGRALDDGEEAVEVTLSTADGRMRGVEFRISPVRGEGPAAVAVGRERETPLESQTLARRERAMRRAYDVIGDSSRSLEEKIEALLGIVRETLDTEFATLSHVDGDDYHIESFDGPEDAPIGKGDVVSLGATNCEQVVATTETLALGDVERDAPELADRSGNAELGISAYLGTPVLVDGATHGTFCFYDREPRSEAFSEWERTFVELLGNWVSNRLERERLLEAQHDRYLDALLEHSTDRVSVLDADGNYRFVSPAVERQLGYDPETLAGEPGFEYVHPEDRDRVEAAFERLLDEPDGSAAAEYRFRHADGSWRWVETRATNRLDDPVIEGIVVNSRDVTERRAREQRLVREQALTESVFEALPDIFYAYDADRNFLRWSDELTEVTGYTDEEVASLDPADLIAPEERDRARGIIARVLETDAAETLEAPLITKGGERIPYEFTGAKMTDDDGEVLGLVGVGRDVSRRKRRSRQFEAVFDNTYQFTGLLDRDGTLLEANDTALSFGGLDRADVVGTVLWDTPWFRGDAREAVRKGVAAARRGDDYREDLTVHGAMRSERVDFSVRPILDETGAVSRLVFEGHPIGDLKRRERHLSVLHRFLRHNVRNKMTVINGNAGMIADATDGKVATYAEMIASAATELVELTETAHELSKATIEADAEPSPTSVEPVVRDVVSEYRERHPDATIVARSVDARVMADERLRLVVAQLVENAIVHNDDEPTVTVSVVGRDDRAAITVADDGPGIPEDELVGVVNDDRQTQLTHGSGIGLWLVRSVVDEYDGVVTHERRPGGGSAISVVLPRAGSPE